MDIRSFLNTFGLDESSLTDKDREKLANAIENDKHSIAYGVYKKASLEPVPRKVFLDEYSLLKVTKTPEQLATEVIQGTVENKNISNTMNEYSDNKTQLPVWVKELAGIDDNTAYETPRKIAFDKLKPIDSQQLKEEILQGTLRPDNGNKNPNGGLGAASDVSPPGDDAATKQLGISQAMNQFGSDMKSAPWLNAGIGAGSIALSQMQGNGLVGTGVNLAATLGGSMAGEHYLGKTLNNSTIGRVGGGLAGHTIANILMGLFRNPQEQQLLDQGMQYQNQNGGMG
jgi:hypothetical protein